MTTPGRVGAKTINPAEVLERSRIGPLQIRVFILCMICLIMDGFDVQALGYAAPPLVREFGLPPSALGSVFAAANFGVLIGSLVFSAVADRIGRRPVIIAMTLFFAAMTLLTAQAQNLTQLFWLRLVSGIGLGSIMPNATALIGEYSPQRSRVTLMMCITVGFTAGAAIGGFIAAALIPAFGWRSVFYFGGLVPLVIGAIMFAALPESIQFLVVRRRQLDKVGAWLMRIDPSLRIDSQTEYTANEERRRGAPFVYLFRDGRGMVTVLLWIVNFMNLLNLYALANWLATVVTGMGYPTQTAVLVSTALQVGGTIGTFGLAWLIARSGFVSMLIATFAVATLSIAAIGQPGISLGLLFVLVFIAGWCVVGGQPGLNALAATFYPTDIRSTGVGWGLGIGRMGAIVGPYVGGMLMARQWTTQQLFLAAAVPALISTITMIVLRLTMKTPDLDGSPVSASH
jgi:AAHS family 4-hydroxybenzoate transporter-like MFS transporter